MARHSIGRERTETLQVIMKQVTPIVTPRGSSDEGVLRSSTWEASLALIEG